MLRRVTLLGLFALAFACDRQRAHEHPAGDPTSARWAAAHGPAEVAAHARHARALGLVPILYFDAPYTQASARLVNLRDTPQLTEALAGTFVVAVDPANVSEYAALQTGYWHSLHSLDDDGHPTAPSLDPGTKDGPCANGDATACAAWLRPFVDSLTRDR